MSEQATAAPAAPLTEGNPSPETVEAPKSTERMFTVKLPDGKEEQWTESAVLQRAQKSVGLEGRVAQAAKLEQAFTNFVAKVQEPTQLLELLNHPDLKYDDDKQEALVKAMLSSKKPRIIEAVKRWIYDNEVEPGMLKEQDPKEYEKRQWQKKAEDLESEKLKREQQIKDQEEAEEQTRIKEAYRVKLGEAFKASGLPVDDFLVRQVMEKARLYVRAGKHPDFDNCCKLVQADFVNHVKGVLGKATVDNILSLMDGETPQLINKALMKALDKKDVPVEVSKSTKPRAKQKEMTPEERKKWIRNLERGIVD